MYWWIVLGILRVFFSNILNLVWYTSWLAFRNASITNTNSVVAWNNLAACYTVLKAHESSSHWLPTCLKTQWLFHNSFFAFFCKCRVRPRARFCVIFHTKILKNAWKSWARVWITHVEKNKRMKIMDRRFRFQFGNTFIAPDVPIFKENGTLEMHVLDKISFKNRSRLRRLQFKNSISK